MPRWRTMNKHDHRQARPPDWELIGRTLQCDGPAGFNIGWHCTDGVCAAGRGTVPALVCEGAGGVIRSFSFDDLRVLSDGAGAYLQTLGVGMGTRVCVLMDRIPELYVIVLAALKIGAVVQPLFSAFGEEALRARLADAETGVVATQRRYVGKLRRIRSALPQLSTVLVVDCGNAALEPGEAPFNLAAMKPVTNLAVVRADRDTPSLLHYTSGTTGKAKGVLHVHGSLLSQYYTGQTVLDLKTDDRYWCTADPGWVTGISYGIIAPWLLGVTQYVYAEGFKPDRWYEFIARYRISVWYTAPTAVRALAKAGDDLARSFDLRSLRHLASVGEPLNAEAVNWSARVLGKPFHDTYWQTETGAIMIANRPGLAIRPGSMGLPVPGIEAAVLDPVTFAPVASGMPGVIAFKRGWPAMMTGYWRNPDATHHKLHGDWYLTGDRGRTDADGYFWFIGRDDDIINTAGHLVSPFEVESVLLTHPAVAESAVVSKPDAMNMEVVKAYVVLKPGITPSGDLELELMQHVRIKLSSYAMPQETAFVAELPKTRSGKILRRLLRARAWGEDITGIPREDAGSQ